jgi:pyruvate dehydrogenase E2 component (dihydrolipoamide acetyltransferase)
MSVQVLMPALSPTMTHGKLAKWLVSEGDIVTAGDIIAEIETDKATMEVEAVDEGILDKILVPEGASDIAVNSPIAVIAGEGDGEADENTAGLAPEAVSAPGPASAPAGTPDRNTDNIAVPELASLEPEPAVQPSPEPVLAPAERAGDERVFASPVARRLAAQGNVDLAGLRGSGPKGRIVKLDVEKALASSGAGNVDAPAAAARHGTAAAAGHETSSATAITGTPSAMSDNEIMATYPEGDYELVPHDGMRTIIAERLTLAKTTIPHFYLSIDCELDALLAARKKLNASALHERDGANNRLSVNDFIVKAMALALQKVPAANATWSEQGILRHKHSDVAVAVAVEGGLFTPVLRMANTKSLSEISAQVKDMASRARNKRLAPEEYRGGTTAISNLGMYGIKSFAAVINPPHATILAVGQGEKRAIVNADDNNIEVATVMSVTLSCDHRVVDGALGAELLNAFRNFIEDPVTMLA